MQQPKAFAKGVGEITQLGGVAFDMLQQATRIALLHGRNENVEGVARTVDARGESPRRF